jgi:hypothetical protein
MRGLRAVRLRIDSSQVVLADLAAGIDDTVRNAARIAGAGVDDCEGVAEPAAVGACQFRRVDVPVKERSAPNGRSPAHFLTLGWSQPQV